MQRNFPAFTYAGCSARVKWASDVSPSTFECLWGEVLLTCTLFALPDKEWGPFAWPDLLFLHDSSRWKLSFLEPAHGNSRCPIGRQTRSETSWPLHPQAVPMMPSRLPMCLLRPSSVSERRCCWDGGLVQLVACFSDPACGMAWSLLLGGSRRRSSRGVDGTSVDFSSACVCDQTKAAGPACRLNRLSFLVCFVGHRPRFQPISCCLRHCLVASRARCRRCHRCSGCRARGTVLAGLVL